MFLASIWIPFLVLSILIKEGGGMDQMVFGKGPFWDDQG